MTLTELQTILDTELISKHQSLMLRQHINSATVYNIANRLTTANVAVINPADKCALTCSNCIYSAALSETVFNGFPPHLKEDDYIKTTSLLNQAKTKHLIFSGGGEPFENMPALTYILKNSLFYEQVVIITSGYFATTDEKAKDFISSAINAIRDRKTPESKPVDFILRLSLDSFHNVPLENYKRLIALKKSFNAFTDINFHIIIRSVLADKNGKELILRDELKGILKPNPEYEELPVIDGVPISWLQFDNEEIPIMYKPIYFEGFGKKQSKLKSNTSWQKIMAIEESHNGGFNMSLRGSSGEGHNYYWTFLKGYENWVTVLNKEYDFVTLKNFKSKSLCIYIPADGRVFINAGVPDAYMYLKDITSWDMYLENIYRDILQSYTIANPTSELINLIAMFDENIHTKLDQNNFVITVVKTCLETPLLRTLAMISILKNKNCTASISDEIVELLLTVNPEKLKNIYSNSIKIEITENIQKHILDPIVGQEKSIYPQSLS